MSDSTNISSRATSLYAAVHDYIASKAVAQSGIIHQSWVDAVAETSKRKTASIFGPLDDKARLAVCESMMEYVDRNMPHLGAVGLFYREFMGFLMTADPQTAILLAASIQWNQSAKAIVTIPFDVWAVADAIRTRLVIPFLMRWLAGAGPESVAKQEELRNFFVATMLEIREVLARHTTKQQEVVKSALLRRIARDPRTASSVEVVRGLLSDADPDQIHISG